MVKSFSINGGGKCKDLIYHDFFITLSDVLHKVDRIEFITHGETDITKNRVLHHVVRLKTKKLEEEITKLLKSTNIDKVNAQELKYEIASAFNRTSLESNTIASEDFKNWGINDKDIKAILEGCEEFKEVLTEGLSERIESISTNRTYHSNYDKVSAILEVMAMSYFMMPRMIKDVFDRMNGRFAKYNKKYEND